VKEEQDDEEATKAVQMAEYERRQRLIASNDDPEDCTGLHTAYMASLNDNDAWRGDLNAAIAMSICNDWMPLVDLTSEAGPNGVVNDEPIEYDKLDVVVDDMYNFHQYTTPLAAASTTRLGFSLNFIKFCSNLCNM
jgi:hypothetical protein